jgi:hypothetical protein
LIPGPDFLISDAVTGGNEHFYWLPPMADDPGSFTTAFDGSLSPVVRICDLADCAANQVAEFTTTTGPGSETVRVMGEDQHYIVNWHTDESNVSPGPIYRITVLAGGTPLGFADVQFRASGQDAKNLSTDQIIGLLDGRTLPIKFRIEEGAVFVISPTDGGTVEALDGTVTIEIPPGALAEETGITVEPVDEANPPEPLPDDGDALPGTVVDFGPDGLEFEEPVELALPIPATLPVGVILEALRLYRAGRRCRSGQRCRDGTDHPLQQFRHPAGWGHQLRRQWVCRARFGACRGGTRRHGDGVRRHAHGAERPGLEACHD